MDGHHTGHRHVDTVPFGDADRPPRTSADLRTDDPRPSLAARVVSRLRRDTALAVLDAAVVVAAYLTTLVIRFDGAVPGSYWASFWSFIPVIVFFYLLTNYLFGLYGQMWRYASVQEARRLVLAGVLAAVGALAAGLWLGSSPRLPLSVTALGAMLSVIGCGALRLQSRLFSFRRRAAIESLTRVLIVGAGEAGSMLIRDILRHSELRLYPVGVIDDDRRKSGLALHGVPVRGERGMIPALVDRLSIDQVLLAIPSASSELVRHVAALCEEAGVSLRVLPSVQEMVNGTVTARDIRDLRIEDLLGRKQVKTDLDAVAALLQGRRVLITGAGGSIGSEIARQVLSFGPSELILLDHDETHLHDVKTQVKSATTVLADIRQRDRIFDVFERMHPQIVFHAAAHKHVPILEDYPDEAVMTNIIGTANVADAAHATGVSRFVLISTDKAVRPKSVMGASKWFAEQVVRSLHGNGTAFCAVRFGNVLGSRGSVIPTFFKQIATGGPVTVTDPAMTRYFMSIPEAVQLVLQAGALACGGEVFTLDMGEPVRIIDLARKLIRLSGRVPDRDIAIETVGVRPGEKLAEDIIDLTEESAPSAHPSIVVSIPPTPNRAALRACIGELERLASRMDRRELATAITRLASSLPSPVLSTRKVMEIA